MFMVPADLAAGPGVAQRGFSPSHFGSDFVVNRVIVVGDLGGFDGKKLVLYHAEMTEMHFSKSLLWFPCFTSVLSTELDNQSLPFISCTKHVMFIIYVYGVYIYKKCSC